MSRARKNAAPARRRAHSERDARRQSAATAGAVALVDPSLRKRPARLTRSLSTLATAALTQPAKSVASLGRVGAELVKAFAGRSAIEPPTADRRFEDAAWRDSPVYRRLMQSYLALSTETQRWVQQLALPRAMRRAQR